MFDDGGFTKFFNVLEDETRGYIELKNVWIDIAKRNTDVSKAILCSLYGINDEYASLLAGDLVTAWAKELMKAQ